MRGDEAFLHILAPLLFRFGGECVLKLFPQRISYLIIYEGVCKTAPAKPGLLKMAVTTLCLRAGRQAD